MGVPDQLFWRSLPSEIATVLREWDRIEAGRERAAALNSGLVASTLLNLHRKKGGKVWKPSDFIRDPAEPDDEPERMTVEEASAMLGNWAASINAKVDA